MLTNNKPIDPAEEFKSYSFPICMKAFAAAALTSDDCFDEVPDPTKGVISFLTKDFQRTGEFSENELKTIARILFQGTDVAKTITSILGNNQHPFFIEIFNSMDKLTYPYTIQHLISETGLDIDFEQTSNPNVVAIVLEREMPKAGEEIKKDRKILTEVLYYNAIDYKSSRSNSAGPRGGFLQSPFGPIKPDSDVVEAVLSVAIERLEQRGVQILGDDGIRDEGNGYSPMVLKEHAFVSIYKILTASPDVAYLSYVVKLIEFDLLVKQQIRPCVQDVQVIIDALVSPLSINIGASEANSDISDQEQEEIARIREMAIKAYLDLKPFSLAESLSNFTLNQFLYYARLLSDLSVVSLANCIKDRHAVDATIIVRTIKLFERGGAVDSRRLNIDTLIDFYGESGVPIVDDYVKELRR